MVFSILFSRLPLKGMSCQPVCIVLVSIPRALVYCQLLSFPTWDFSLSLPLSLYLLLQCYLQQYLQWDCPIATHRVQLHKPMTLFATRRPSTLSLSIASSRFSLLHDPLAIRSNEFNSGLGSSSSSFVRSVSIFFLHTANLFLRAMGRPLMLWCSQLLSWMHLSHLSFV